jgi:hypothetical protein
MSADVESPDDARPIGRPTKYKPQYVEEAAHRCLNGATNYELAEFFGVDRGTIRRWANEHPDFRTAINVGKEAADERVVASLFERAAGYSHPDVHISNFQGDVTITPIVKHYAPDTAAAFIWLKNRRGWKDKTEVEHTVVSLSDRMRNALTASNEPADVSTPEA